MLFKLQLEWHASLAPFLVARTLRHETLSDELKLLPLVASQYSAGAKRVWSREGTTFTVKRLWRSTELVEAVEPEEFKRRNGGGQEAWRRQLG